MVTIRTSKDNLKRAYSILSDITNFSFNIKDRIIKIDDPDWVEKSNEIESSLNGIEYEVIK